MTKKLRIRNARYQDVHHIETLLQAAIERANHADLPPIERPHIYNHLNHCIARAEVFVAVVDGQLAGFAAIEPLTFPWNANMAVYATAYFVTAPNHRHHGTAEALLGELIATSKLSGVTLVIRPTPGIDSGLTTELLDAAGFPQLHGTHCFQPVENRAE